jgi:hypothetical protein
VTNVRRLTAAIALLAASCSATVHAAPAQDRTIDTLQKISEAAC